MRYEMQYIERAQPPHWRITDTKTDSRIATCYVRDNAETIVAALNGTDEAHKDAARWREGKATLAAAIDMAGGGQRKRDALRDIGDASRESRLEDYDALHRALRAVRGAADDALADADFLRSLAQNDYMIDGKFLPTGVRLLAIADGLADADRWRWWLNNGMQVERDEVSAWTCWLSIPCIPYRMKEGGPNELTDALITRFPIGGING